MADKGPEAPRPAAPTRGRVQGDGSQLGAGVGALPRRGAPPGPRGMRRVGRRGAVSRRVRRRRGRPREPLLRQQDLLRHRRQKYTEALDRHLRAEEGQVLVNAIKALAPFDEEAAKMVAALENFRQRERVDTASARNAVALEVTELIQANPLFQDKLDFPSVQASRLGTMINQSLNWQHLCCKKPKQNPEPMTLFSDQHLCCKKPKQNPEPMTLFSDHSCDSRSLVQPRNTAPDTHYPMRRTPKKASRKHPRLSTTVPGFDCPVKRTPKKASRKHPRIRTSAPGIDDPMKRTSVGQPDEVLMQPPIVNATGSVLNLSSPTAVQSEQPDRILPTLSTQAPMGASRIPDVKRKDESLKIRTWKLSGPVRTLCLPDTATSCSKVVSLLYTNNGMSLLALSSNAIHKLWKWQCSDTNPNEKIWQQANEIAMKNDSSDGNPEEATACIALPKNESYVVSASGGEVSMFSMMTFQGLSQVMSTFMAPPPAATVIAFHPQEIDIIALEMEDSTIQIYNLRAGQVTNKLKGHNKKITGLSFSQLKNVLVSSSADGQLCVWSIDGWEKKESRYHSGALDGNTTVQFHNDGSHLLVVHESQLAIYDWKLHLLCSRVVKQTPISCAVYSCDRLLVYAGLCNGVIAVLEVESLWLHGTIKPHHDQPLSGNIGSVYPMVIAAHPSEPSLIALGMSNGSVIFMKFPDMDAQQGTAPPQENGAQQGDISNAVASTS